MGGFILKILLIDDHKILSTGLKNSLEGLDPNKKIYIIDDYIDSEEIISLGKDSKYDVLLIDINLKKLTDLDGLELAEKILENRPDKKIIILTGYDNLYFKLKSKEIGVKAFVKKDIDMEKLDDILNEVYNDDYKDEFTKREFVLTEREKEIVVLYSKGNTRDELANKLFISKRTLGNHLHAIYEKLDVNNVQEMITKATKLGYIKDNLF